MSWLLFSREQEKWAILPHAGSMHQCQYDKINDKEGRNEKLRKERDKINISAFPRGFLHAQS